MSAPIAHPFRVDGRGRVATAEDGDHLDQLVEQVLFTAPGERVNRPDFGTGLGQLVFAPNSEELQTAVEYLVQGALQQWLGDLLQVQDVAVTHDDATLSVTVRYVVLRTQEPRTTTVSRSEVQ
jgi:phage baseplate assembly protein W